MAELNDKDTEMTTSPAFTPTPQTIAVDDEDSQMMLSDLSPSSTAMAGRGGAPSGGNIGSNSSKAAPALQTHPASGYQWSRDEDAPGWCWKNRKAQDEANKAWHSILDKDLAIKGRFGDVGLKEAQSSKGGGGAVSGGAGKRASS